MSVARSRIPLYEFTFIAGIMASGRVERLIPSDVSPRSFHYELSDLGLAHSLLNRLGSTTVDLVDVAVAVYIADRLAPRAIRGDARLPDDRWHRRIQLTVPLRCPEVWSDPAVREMLSRYLHFLTDDDWSIQFVRRDADLRMVELVTPLFNEAPPSSVLLFSGGLDSLLGLIQIIESGVDRVMPLTVSTSSRIGAMVDRVLDALPAPDYALGSRVVPARIGLHLVGGKLLTRLRDECESSQRARSFLFLGAAAAVANAAGLQRVDVLENGIGAIGLPMTGDHWGSRATKAMHPKALGLFSTLCSLVFDSRFEVRNHGAFETKRQLITRLVDPTLAKAVDETSSCDRFTLAGPTEPCGSCTSCLERSVAIMSSPFIKQVPIDSDDGKARVAGRFQLESLRQVLSNRSWPDFLRAFPMLPDAYGALRGNHGVDVEQRLVTLFSSHVLEVDDFFAATDDRTFERPATLRSRPITSSRLPLAG